MSEQLFTDQDAAKVLERVSPEMAATLQRLLAEGETPGQIYTRLKKKMPLTGQYSPVLPLILQAAHHYQSQR